MPLMVWLVSMDPTNNPNAGWIASLKYEDLRRLRVIVKRVHMIHYPGEFATDREADKLIEALGPEVAMHQLKAGIDRGLST